MKVLITGGAGFIGSNLVARLRRDDDLELHVFDNESLGHRAHVDFPGVAFTHGDIRDPDALRPAMQGSDVVVHLAADTRVMDSIENPRHNFEHNVTGSFEVLMLAHELGVKRIVNASTGGAILGEAPSPVNEEMPARPLAPYGASKLAVEGYCSAFAGAYGLQATSLRFSNVYGPGSFHKGSVVAHFFKRILRGEPLVVYGDGSQQRDFLYIGDLTQAVAQAVRKPASGVLQLGSGRPTRIDSLIETMREVVPRLYPIDVRYEAFRAGEIHTTYCDISRARRQLNFAPATSLRDGLAATWAWFESNRQKL